MAVWVVVLAVLVPVLVPVAWAGAPAAPGAVSERVGVGRGPAAGVVAEVNLRRARAGCRPVRLRVPLGRAARAHSVDMAARRRLDHTGSDGSRPQERMRAAGYRPGRSGEAIASGVATAGAVVELWWDSRRHRALVLDCRFRDAGVGRAEGAGGPWWTLDLAARR